MDSTNYAILNSGLNINFLFNYYVYFLIIINTLPDIFIVKLKIESKYSNNNKLIYK